jgi:hypothetical protein
LKDGLQSFKDEKEKKKNHLLQEKYTPFVIIDVMSKRKSVSLKKLKEDRRERERERER